jgi:hypothetical protein
MTLAASSIQALLRHAGGVPGVAVLDSSFVPVVIAVALIVLGILLDRLADIRIEIPRFFEPYRLVNVVLLVRNPSRYALALESLLVLKDLDDPQDRADALDQLGRLVAAEDIVDGFYEIGDPSWSPKRLWRETIKLYEGQSRLAGVEPTGLRNADRPRQGAAPDHDDGVLLLGIVASVQGLTSFPSSPKLADELAALVKALPSGGVGDRSSLSLWFTPLTGETLDEEDGRNRFGAVLASTI